MSGKYHIESETSRVALVMDTFCMYEENKVKQTMKMEVRGTRVKGRPRMWWMDNIRQDMSKCGLEEGDAQDRRRWRRSMQNHDLAS